MGACEGGCSWGTGILPSRLGLGRWLGRGGSVRYSLGFPPFTSFLPLSHTFVKSIFLQHFPFLPCFFFFFFSTRALCFFVSLLLTLSFFFDRGGKNLTLYILKRLCNSIKTRDVSISLGIHCRFTRVFTEGLDSTGNSSWS